MIWPASDCLSSVAVVWTFSSFSCTRWSLLRPARSSFCSRPWAVLSRVLICPVIDLSCVWRAARLFSSSSGGRFSLSHSLEDVVSLSVPASASVMLAEMPASDLSTSAFSSKSLIICWNLERSSSKQFTRAFVLTISLWLCCALTSLSSQAPRPLSLSSKSRRRAPTAALASPKTARAFSTTSPPDAGFASSSSPLLFFIL
mmetsp:Transcript_35222/g.100618  ORF Transcript_35222/g.100618 Transcript_35222/m.100618 type:complete len:201 (-) Transcript_35222:1333-1935(-)